MNLHDVLRALVDRAGIHSEQERIDLRDTIDGHEQGFKTMEEYRESQKPAPTADEEEAARVRYEEIQKRRAAQQQVAQEQQAAIPQPVATRPAAPAPVETAPPATEPSTSTPAPGL